MNQVLLHGAAIKQSRIKLQELKSKFHPDNVVVFDKGEDVENILVSLNSESLFGGERLIILENPSENLVLNSELLTQHSSFIIWFDHDISKKPIFEWFEKNGQVIFFPDAKERTIFPFLDMLASGESKAFLELEKLKEGGLETQYFITMVFYLLRNLAVTPKNAPSFVKQKLQKQRKNFDMEKVQKIYKNILEIDFKIKSGLLETNQAEFMLINQFI